MMRMNLTGVVFNDTAMKKVYIFIALTTVLSVFSCTREDVGDSQNSQIRTKRVSLTAVADTKTTFGTPTDGAYPVEWTDDDTSIAFSVGSSTEIKQAARTATRPGAYFDADISTSDASFTIKAVSPSVAYRSYYHESSRLNIAIPAGQTCTNTSPDPSAQILYSVSDEFTEIPDQVDLVFHHITGYLHINFTNVASPEDIISVNITSEDVDLAGRMFYYTGSHNSNANNMVKSITVTPQSISNVWAGIAPADLRNKTLSFTLVSASETLTRSITFPSDDKYNLTSGTIGTFSVNMATAAVGTPEKFVKVTDESELAIGNEIIIVSESGQCALSTAQNTNNRGTAGVTIEGGIIWSPGDAVQRITLKDSDVTPGTEFTLATSTGNLYFATGGNNLRTEYMDDKREVNRSWNITFNTGNANITTASGTRKLRYNSGSDIFSAYESEQVTVQIYKKVPSHILWRETWKGGTKYAEPAAYLTAGAAGTSVYGGSSVSYSSANGGQNTRLYTEGIVFLNSTAQKSPSTYLPDFKINNLMIGKTGGYFKVEGIPCNGVQKATLSFYSNSTLNTTDHSITASDNVSIGAWTHVSYSNKYNLEGASTTEEKTVHYYSCDIDLSEYSGDTFWLQFNNNGAGNIRTGLFEVKAIENK